MKKFLLILALVTCGLTMAPSQGEAGPVVRFMRERQPVRSFFRNRQPLRKVARIVSAPFRALRNRGACCH